MALRRAHIGKAQHPVKSSTIPAAARAADIAADDSTMRACLDHSDSASASGKTTAVVGGGPAGLIAAEVLARAGAAVTVYDQMPSVGRKFLLAGRGGLNLTHSEELPQFLTRYGANRALAAPCDRGFSAVGACAPGLKAWNRPPSWAQADASFPVRSRRHLCCAPGSAGSPTSMSLSRHAIIGPAGTARGSCASSTQRKTCSFRRM